MNSENKEQTNIQEVNAIEEIKEEIEEVQTVEPTVIYKEVMHITAEDMKEYNHFVYGRKKSYFFTFIGIFLIIIGIIGFIQNKPDTLVSNIFYTAFGVMLVVYSLILAPLLLKSRIEKIQTEDQEPIEIQISEDGVFSKYEAEEIDPNQPIIPFGWNLVHRVMSNEKFIFILMVDFRTVLLVKCSDVKDVNFIYFLKEKAQSLNKWVELKK